MRQSKPPGGTKVVLDASVVVSAAFGGKPAQAVQKAFAYTLIVSAPIVEELDRVALNLRPRLGAERSARLRQLLRTIVNKGQTVQIAGRLHICRDPNDDMYLETCQVARAHYLVTGDPDLLDVDLDALKKHRLGRLAIVTAARFVEE